jgi:hypothetical protein
MLTAAGLRTGRKGGDGGGGKGEDGRRKDEKDGESVVEDGRGRAQTSSPKKGHREPKTKDDGKHGGRGDSSEYGRRNLWGGEVSGRSVVFQVVGSLSAGRWTGQVCSTLNSDRGGGVECAEREARRRTHGAEHR